MADDANDLFIFGDDFEAILEILESDEGLEEQFVAAVSEVSVRRFSKNSILAWVSLYRESMHATFCNLTCRGADEQMVKLNLLVKFSSSA